MFFLPLCFFGLWSAWITRYFQAFDPIENSAKQIRIEPKSSKWRVKEYRDVNHDLNVMTPLVETTGRK